MPRGRDDDARNQSGNQRISHAGHPLEHRTLRIEPARQQHTQTAPQVGSQPAGQNHQTDVSGDWQLTVINPAQYRAPILAAIAADARTTSATFGEGYAVDVEGMSNRVTWRQSGPLELSLFIPYEMTVTPRP